MNSQETNMRTQKLTMPFCFLLLLTSLCACGSDKSDRIAKMQGTSEEVSATPESGEAAKSAPTAPSSVGSLGMVLASSLNVRSGPGMDGSRVGLLSCGDVVKIEAQQGEWYQVRVEDVEGWSHMAWLNPIRAGGRMPVCGNPEFVGKSPAVPTKPVLNPKPDPKLPLPPGPEPIPTPITEKLPPPQPPPPSGTPTPAPTPKPAKGKGPESIPLAVASAKPGKVTFPHHLHNQQFDCAQCHHPVSADIKQQAKSDKDCRSCHPRAEGVGISPVKSKDAFHNTCRGCHQTSGAGPTKCAECHVAG